MDKKDPSRPAAHPAEVQPAKPPASDHTDGLSIAAIISAFFVPLVGLILGIIARQKAVRENTSKTVAVVAIWVSAAWMLLGVVLLGALVAVAILSDVDVAESPSSAMQQEKTTINGNAYDYTLRVRQGFADISTSVDNPDADIMYGDERRDVYVMVVAEPMVDFEPTVGVEEYADLVKDGVRSSLSNPDIFALKSAEAANPEDYDVEDFVANGSVDGLKLTYVYRVTRVGTTFYQIIGWTTPSKYQENKAEIFDMLASFKAE